MLLEAATAMICMAHAIYFEARSESTAAQMAVGHVILNSCLLYTSPSPRDGLLSRMPSSA